MIVNGVPFNCDVKDVVNELKVQLSANGIQRFYKVFDSGDDIMVCCPYHKDGQEQQPSAGIRKSDGVLHCFACGVTVGLDKMIANCFGYEAPSWGYRWLVKNFATVKVEERKDIELDFDRRVTPKKKQVEFLPVDELDKYRYTHPYLYERGLTDEVIERFALGYDSTTDSITFPVRGWGDADFGKTLFVAKRNIQTKRFDLPKDLDKPLYGLYEIWQVIKSDPRIFGVQFVYVCEGLFDCLRLWCNNIPAVAGFGCLYSEYQMRLLEALPTRRLVLAFDNDKAGKDGAKRVRNRVKNKVISEVILPEGRKDIGECTDDEIKGLREVF